MIVKYTIINTLLPKSIELVDLGSPCEFYEVIIFNTWYVRI